MRGVLDNKRGQTSMMLIPFLIVSGVVAVIILFSMMPELSDGSNTARNQDGLNCKSGAGLFDDNGVPMYNASRNTDNLTCVIEGFVNIYFIMGAILVIVLALMAGNMFGGLGQGQSAPVESYPRY